MSSPYPSLAETETDSPIEIVPLNNSTIESLSEPMHGTVSLRVGGAMLYSPERHFFGTDSISYTYRTGGSSPALGSISLAVRDTQGHASGLHQISTRTPVDATLAIDPFAADGDLANPAIRLTAIGWPRNGGIAVLPQGSLTYVPNLGFSGRDCFTYNTIDSQNQVAQTSVTIDVRGLGEPFLDGTFFTDETGWLPGTTG